MERNDQTGDTIGAVIFGVFAGFASGQLIVFQEMGLGLGVALVIDATIIRSVLLPSAMRLLGDWNWYVPRWLEWLPRLHIEAQPGTRALGDTSS